MFNRDIEIASVASTASGASPAGHQAETPSVLVELLMEMLPYGSVTIVCVAAELRMSVRTLQRRLGDCGLSFEQIVDDIRRSAAIHQVLAGECTATEIAFTLGYSDLAHFSRAFKRWTGMSPRQYGTFCPC